MGNAVSMRLFDEAQVHGLAGRGPSNDLDVLTSRVEELAGELRMLVQSDAPKSVSEARLVDEARKIYQFRRRVDELFDYDGFSRSPAWDIMLDLFEANASGKSISASSAGIGAACPETTALRWLHALEVMGLIVRTSDPSDKRRTLIALTHCGLQMTTKALRLRLDP